MPPTAEGTAKQTWRLIRDSLVYSPARLVPAVVALAWLAAFTRLFEADEYGQFSVIVAGCTVVGTLLMAWIRESSLRLLPRYEARGERDRYLAQVGRMLLLTAGAVLLLAGAGWPLRGVVLGPLERFYVVAAVLVVGEALYGNLQTINTALRRRWTYTALAVGYAALRLGLAMGLVLLVRRDVAMLVLATAASYLLCAGAGAVALGYGPRLRPAGTTDRVLWRSAVAYGLPLVGFLVVAQLLNVSDRMLLLVLRGADEAGIYASNYNLVSMGLQLLAAPVILAAHPLVVRQWEQGQRASIGATIASFTRLHLLLVLPAVVFAGVFSRELAALVLGEEFRAGHGVIAVVAPGVLAFQLSIYGRKGLELREDTRTLLGLALVCLVVNVGGNLLLLPRFGYVAAAWTTLAAFALFPLLIGWQARAHLVWRVPWGSAARVLVAAAAAGGIPAALKWGWFGGALPLPWFAAAAALGLGIYVLALGWLGELRAVTPGPPPR